MTRLRLGLALGGVVVAGLIAGCGGGSDNAPTGATAPTSARGQKLTIDQAQVLARTLYRNFVERGADFTIRCPVGPGVFLVMTGSIDFRASSGAMLLQVSRDGGPLSRGRRVVWTRSTVLEGDIPGLQEAMAGKDRPGVLWVERPIRPDRSPVDSSLVFLNRLASARPDNPAIIAQGAGRFLREDTLDGTPVSVFRLRRNLTLTVADTGLLRRASARLQSTSGPVVVTLRRTAFATRRCHRR